jgi:uncharacterized protein
MKPSDALQAHRQAVRDIVAANRGRNPRVFGSVLTGEDTESSDLDLLVETTPQTSLLDIGAMRLELRRLLGVRVDVLTPGALPDKFRDDVLATAMPI